MTPAEKARGQVTDSSEESAPGLRVDQWPTEARWARHGAATLLLIALVSSILLLEEHWTDARRTRGLPPLRINEIAAHSGEEGADWIEILNPTESAVSLEGWSLTDKRGDPRRWSFPKVELAPGACLLVFACGGDEAPRAGLRCGFRLSSRGEYLGLIGPGKDPVTVSELAPGYPAQVGGYSYGFDEAGSCFGFYRTPSPGVRNPGGESLRERCAPVTATPERGFFDESVSATLSCADSAARIRYTLGGAEPTPEVGMDYHGPLAIRVTSVLRARAFRLGFVPSPTTTHTFVVNAPNSHQRLPLLSLVTAASNLTGPSGMMGMSDAKRRGKFLAKRPWRASGEGYYNPSKRGLGWERPTSLELLSPLTRKGLQLDCGLRVSGSDWSRARLTPDSKFSFKIYLRGRYGSRRLRRPAILGSDLSHRNRLRLRGGYGDAVSGQNVLLRDGLVRRLWRDMGHPGVDGVFCQVLMNGKPIGHYILSENIDERFLQVAFKDKRSWDAVQRRGDELAGDRVAWLETLAHAAKSFIPDASKRTAVQRRLELRSFADYLLLHAYCGAGDWPFNNWTAVRPRGEGGRFHFLVWDADEAFGALYNDVSVDVFLSELLHVAPKDNELPRLYRTLLADDRDLALCEPGAIWRYKSGAAAEAAGSARWRELDFDDSDWKQGPSSLGYGDGDDATLLTNMRNRYISVYARRSFQLADPKAFRQLVLSVRFDDAFVAYLNGVEVCRSKGLRGRGSPPAATARSSRQHEAVHEDAFSISLKALRPGRNVLAVQVHNASLDSSDLSFEASLLAFSRDGSSPFRRVMRERVQKHFFGAGALTDVRLRRRYEEIHRKLAPIVPGFDSGSGRSVSVGRVWLPKRREIFLSQLRRHGFLD